MNSKSYTTFSLIGTKCGADIRPINSASLLSFLALRVMFLWHFLDVHKIFLKYLKFPVKGVAFPSPPVHLAILLDVFFKALRLHR